MSWMDGWGATAAYSDGTNAARLGLNDDDRDDASRHGRMLVASCVNVNPFPAAVLYTTPASPSRDRDLAPVGRPPSRGLLAPRRLS